MRKLVCSDEIRSDLREVHDLTARILYQAGLHGFAEAALKDLRVALDEAIANAVIHGNANQSQKKIKIRCFLYPEGPIEIRIRDEGSGFNAAELPDPTRLENLLNPHGRGIFLIRNHMDKVSFNRKGNEIRMVKKPTSRRGGSQD